MSPTKKQDSNDAPASAGELERHLATWERQQRTKFRMRVGIALLFFAGMSVMICLVFTMPAKAQEAIGAAVIFGLSGIVQAFLALSSRAEGQALKSCKGAVEAKKAQGTQAPP